MSQRIFRYVVRYDAGTAPRPFGGMCSLAICKPKIRASAQVGDWIIGFRSKQPSHVVYAMQITEKLTLGEYWQDPRFEDRKPGKTPFPDNLYRPGRNGALEQVPNPVHEQYDAAKDIRGRNVLLSSRYWYFGRDSVPIPTELIHLVHTTQGHVVHKQRRSTDIKQLERWLRAWPVGIHGDPIDAKAAPAIEAPKAPSAPTSSRSGAMAASVVRPRTMCSVTVRPPSAMNFARNGPQPDTAPGHLILSRKGFDSGYGGMPSPILPDGRLLPLPIPAEHDRFRMEHLQEDGVDLPALLADLSRGQHSLSTHIHLDPDLNRRADLRLPGWRPSLGQTGAAQSHLVAQGVGIGDVFLFFGWFCEVEHSQGRWRYAPRARHLHVLFGWLEVGDILPVVLERERCLQTYPWIANHPHVANPARYTDDRNTLYVAPNESQFAPGLQGGGKFQQFSQQLCLTATGHPRSTWRLPKWFHPQGRRPPLSYHARHDRWTEEQNHCVLKSVAKGQEFVLNLSHYPEGAGWIRALVSASQSDS